jgi:hypothetical protein
MHNNISHQIPSAINTWLNLTALCFPSFSFFPCLTNAMKKKVLPEKLTVAHILIFPTFYITIFTIHHWSFQEHLKLQVAKMHLSASPCLCLPTGNTSKMLKGFSLNLILSFTKICQYILIFAEIRQHFT